jgi:hypothetical protein
MIGKVVLAALCAVAIAGGAHAADVKMGDVTLNLIPPKGFCDLDASQASDKRLVDFVSQTVSKSGNDLTGISAECGELRDWRSGKQRLLQRYSQYQMQSGLRTSPFSVKEAKASCDQLRAEGQQLSDKSTVGINDKIHEANSKIDFQGQTFLGVLGDDPNGCFVGLFQKYKAETGTAITQINVFYAGSIKERQVFFYVWTPYRDDATVTGLFADMKGYVAALKAANGL